MTEAKKTEIAKWLLDPDGTQSLPHDLTVLEEKLRHYGLWKIYEELELPLAPILDEMRKVGIAVDVALLQTLSKKLEKELTALTKSIYADAGGPFNINSPKQLSAVLFEKLSISPRGIPRRSTGAYSTDAGALETIRERHAIVPAILKYRELFKVQSTYVAPLLELGATSKDHRIHATLLQTSTATGRLSSENPNLQNIPTGTDIAKELRVAFVASPGTTLLSLDYSQIELRVMASVSGDSKMIEAFKNNEDIHKITAASVLGIAPDKVSKEERQMAKTLNFGIIYGMGPQAFARQSGLSYIEAEEFITQYFRNFSGIQQWQERTIMKARETGYVENLNGRKRWVPNIISPNQRSASEARRAAINMPIQSLAADMLKMAMIAVRRVFPDIPLILSIHDELVFEVPDGMLKKAATELRRIMESVYQLSVPVKVDAASGKNWAAIS
ncbi:MAG: DNA polymerase [bacterium]|nr:DNA polymerase [bacterium]